jgi:hypothetical protein
VIKFATVLIIKGEDLIGRGFEVVSSNAIAWITLVVDRCEMAISVTQNRYSARARAVEDEMIKFTAVVVIEGEGAIGCRSEVISTDANAWFAFLIDGREDAVVVTQNPYGARSGAIEHKVIKFAAVVIVESEGEISSGSKVVSGNADVWITLPEDWREDIGWSAHVELRYDMSLE